MSRRRHATTPQPGAPALELAGVDKDYPGDPPIPALRDVDLRIDQGELAAIVGPSGSGKSTLLHVIRTLDRASLREVRLARFPTAAMSCPVLSALRAPHPCLG